MAALTAENPKLYAGPVMEADDGHYIKNGSSWNAGQFLYVDTSGRLVPCASDGVVIKYYALEDASDPGAEDTTLASVGIIVRDHEFIGNELDGTLTTANKGQFYALDVTSNVCTLDAGDTDHDALEVTRLGSEINPAKYDAADTLAKVCFKVLTIALEGAPA